MFGWLADDDRDTDDRGVDGLDCHPERMTVDQLRAVFKVRRVDINDSDSLDFFDLLAVYHRVLLPFPQRKYIDNRRGVELTRSQEMCEKRPKKRSHQVVQEQGEEPENKKRLVDSHKNHSIESKTLDKNHGNQTREGRAKISWP